MLLSCVSQAPCAFPTARKVRKSPIASLAVPPPSSRRLSSFSRPSLLSKRLVLTRAEPEKKTKEQLDKEREQREKLVQGKFRKRTKAMVERANEEKKILTLSFISTTTTTTPQQLLALRGTGIDQATAQKILKAWEGAGLADDPDKFRKLLLSRSLRSAGAILFQALIDAGAAYGAFSWGLLLDNPDAVGDFPGKSIIQALSFFVTGYFIIGVLSDFFVLGALSFATLSYGANAGAVLDAVRDVAGRPSGSSAIDKAAAAVNTLRVVAALNEIAELLKKEVAEGGGSGRASSSSSSSSSVSTLKALSAILTLQRAEEKGFDPASLGLSRNEAAELAAAFARFDANDDMVLQPSELENLIRAEGFDLSREEVAEAARLLDKNGDGLVSFPEFADWYVNKLSVTQQQQKEES